MFILATFAVMAAFPGQRHQLFATLGLTFIVVTIWAHLQQKQRELSRQRTLRVKASNAA